MANLLVGENRFVCLMSSGESRIFGMIVVFVIDHDSDYIAKITSHKTKTTFV